MSLLTPMTMTMSPAPPPLVDFSPVISETGHVATNIIEEQVLANKLELD